MPLFDPYWNEVRYDDCPEEIDNPDQPFSDVERSMDDLARTNRLFGGVATVLTHAKHLLRSAPPCQPLRVLDIATGSADIPRALQTWAQRNDYPLTIVAVDSLPAMLRLARARAPETLLVQADASHLPFAPRSFDIALCSLAFHHFGFPGSIQALRAMDRLTTRGFVVSDLRRDRLSLLGVQAGLKLMRAHPFTQHDGPASVRRAFTPREYEQMVALSGARHVQVRSHWYFRMALVQRKK